MELFTASAASLVAFIPFAIVGFILLGSFFTVSTQTAAVVERFGGFKRIATAGLNLKIPFIDSYHIVDLKIVALPTTPETKTKDNVFVKMPIMVQYRVPEESVRDAYYKLRDEKKQILALVNHVVVSEVPKLTLDEVFERKDEIASAIKSELAAMKMYGYEVTEAYVTDIVPAPTVVEAMNNINAAQRNQEAAKAKGEGDKTLAVKKAEGESESKRLQGEGVANERIAIAKGLEESVRLLKDVSGVDPKEAMNILLMTQYFDSLRAIGVSANTTTIMLPHQPGALTDLMQQITMGLKSSGA